MLYIGNKLGSPTFIKKSESSKNFEIYHKFDVDINDKKIASNFSQYSYIVVQNPSQSAVTSIITKLKLTDGSNAQTSLFDTINISGNRICVWEGSNGRNNGLVPIVLDNWYWVKTIFDISSESYNQYLLSDNNQVYNLKNLPSISEWEVNIKNGNQIISDKTSFVIGNNANENYSSQYIRGSFDLSATQITYADGTVWTPY